MKKYIHVPVRSLTKLCKYCAQCFRYEQTFKSHIISHNGEKPYKCQQCNECFVSPGCLKWHSKKAHSFIQMGSIVQKQIQNEMKKHSCWIFLDELDSEADLLKHYKDHMNVVSDDSDDLYVGSRAIVLNCTPLLPFQTSKDHCYLEQNLFFGLLFSNLLQTTDF